MSATCTLLLTILDGIIILLQLFSDNNDDNHMRQGWGLNFL